MRAVIVTGASRGIGAAIARRCAARGAKVVLSSRKQEGLELVADDIRRAGGFALVHPCHVGQREQVVELFAKARAEFGTVDGLVNNAATNPYFGPMLNIEEAPFDKTFEVNVKGYFECSRQFVLALRQGGTSGAIVNIASVAGMRAAPFQGVYGMTKAAVISMTQTMAHELGAGGIRVNAICPGLIETKFASALINNDALRELVVSRTALKRHGQPTEIAEAAAYLLSDDSSYVTGQCIVIDGGLTAA